jgi:hypothetical protein
MAKTLTSEVALVTESSRPATTKDEGGNEGGVQGQNPSQAIPTHHKGPQGTEVTDPRVWSGEPAYSQGKEVVDRGRIELPTPGFSVPWPAPCGGHRLGRPRAISRLFGERV